MTGTIAPMTQHDIPACTTLSNTTVRNQNLETIEIPNAPIMGVSRNANQEY